MDARSALPIAAGLLIPLAAQATPSPEHAQQGPLLEAAKAKESTSARSYLEFDLLPVIILGGPMPTPLNVGGQWEMRYRWPAFSAALGSRITYTVSERDVETVPTSGATVAWAMLGCAHLRALYACSVLSFGNIVVRSGLRNHVALEAPVTISLGPRLGAEWRLATHLKLRAFLEVPITLGSPIIRIDERETWRPFPLSAVMGVGFGFPLNPVLG